MLYDTTHLAFFKSVFQSEDVGFSICEETATDGYVVLEFYSCTDIKFTTVAIRSNNSSIMIIGELVGPED